MSSPVARIRRRTAIGSATGPSAPSCTSTVPSVPATAVPRSRAGGRSRVRSGRRRAKSLTGSKPTTRAATSSPATSTVGAVIPATTWATVAMRPSATTNPVPTWAVRQSRPRTCRTEASRWLVGRPSVVPIVGITVVQTAVSVGGRTPIPSSPLTDAVITIPAEAATATATTARTRDRVTSEAGVRESERPYGPPCGGRAARPGRPRAMSGSAPRPSRRSGSRGRLGHPETGWPAGCSVCTPR